MSWSVVLHPSVRFIKIPYPTRKRPAAARFALRCSFESVHVSSATLPRHYDVTTGDPNCRSLDFHQLGINRWLQLEWNDWILRLANSMVPNMYPTVAFPTRSWEPSILRAFQVLPVTKPDTTIKEETWNNSEAKWKCMKVYILNRLYTVYRQNWGK